jgi:putative transcriptional regulator
MKTQTKIRQLAESRGLTTAYQLQKNAGLSSSMAARLWRDEVEMIALTTIDALCDVLECEPGDLFVRESVSKAAKTATDFKGKVNRNLNKK